MDRFTKHGMKRRRSPRTTFGKMSARQEAFSTIEISEDPEGFLFSETGFLKFTPDGQ